jgi:penicillin-binding protein 2
MNPSDDRRPAISPQLALRVALLGGIALTLFAIVFFRLWFLQVLSGEQFVSEARENRTRTVRVQAPRGEIRDRNGDVIVDNRSARVVQLLPNTLPEAEREAAAAWGQAVGRRQLKRPRFRGARVKFPPIATPELRTRYARLGRVVGLTPGQIHRRVIEQLTRLPYAPITIKADASFAQIAYLMENKEAFPGVEPEELYLRRYPKKQLAAQLLGTVGRITPDQLERKRYRGVDRNAIVGQTGLEYEYDRYLRGQDGATVLRIDAQGQLLPGRARAKREPTPGRDLRLSLDLGLQKAGQDALASIGGGRPGAFVAMNPYNGQVYAMGSYPSFDPAVFTKPISDERYQRLFGEAAGSPQVNRATQGFYPTGSTFKPLSAMAGLDGQVITPQSIYVDTGSFRIGTRVATNAGGTANGAINLPQALQVSSTTYFYNVGAELFAQGGEKLQRWAKRFGLGRKTGIDLPEDAPGTVPGRAWRKRLERRERECRKQPGQNGRPCFTKEYRPYNAGDNVNLAVGQGDLTASPLQMAVAYSALVAKGRVPRPHLGLEVQDKNGGRVQEIDPGPARRFRMNGAYRDAILDGLGRGAMVPPGTSSGVWASWPKGRLPVAGKTGTAETVIGGVRGDQSWYVGYIRGPKGRSVVIAATVELGGFGAEKAAPIVCRVARKWFAQPARVCDPPATGTARIASDATN